MTDAMPPMRRSSVCATLSFAMSYQLHVGQAVSPLKRAAKPFLVAEEFLPTFAFGATRGSDVPMLTHIVFHCCCCF